MNARLPRCDLPSDDSRRVRRAERALGLGALGVVAVLGVVVAHPSPVTEWDYDVVAWIAGARSPALVDVARAVTLLGNLALLAVLTLLVWRARSRTAASATQIPRWFPALALALAAAADALAKLLVERPRPPARFSVVVEYASGYPSGHAAQATAALVAIAVTVGQPDTRVRRAAAAALIAFVVGLSRVVLGVHSPTDVVGGWALGVACLLAAAHARRRSPATAPSHAAQPSRP